MRHTLLNATHHGALTSLFMFLIVTRPKARTTFQEQINFMNHHHHFITVSRTHPIGALFLNVKKLGAMTAQSLCNYLWERQPQVWLPLGADSFLIIMSVPVLGPTRPFSNMMRLSSYYWKAANAAPSSYKVKKHSTIHPHSVMLK
jgi:hypothetical protein